MNKFFKAVCAYTALTVFSLCAFIAPHQKVYAAESIDSSLAATTTYFEEYISSLTTFDLRGLEDVLLCLKGGGNISNSSAFLDYMKGLVQTDGTFGSKEISESYTVDYNTPETYALMLLIGEELEFDVTDFNGCNILNSFISSFTNYDMSTETVNPYFLRYIAAAINNYSEDIDTADTLMNKIKTIIKTYYYKSDETGTGIDYWGINTDNNGAVLPALYYLYDSDNEVKEMVDNAVTWTAAQLKADGTVESWGAVSTDSTGLTLSLLASFSNTNADLNYAGLLTLKDSSVSGAYSSAYDIHYATRDAYYGLLSYNALKNNKFFLARQKAKTPIPENNPENNTPETGDISIPAVFIAFSAFGAAMVLMLLNAKEKSGEF